MTRLMRGLVTIATARMKIYGSLNALVVNAKWIRNVAPGFVFITIALGQKKNSYFARMIQDSDAVFARMWNVPVEGSASISRA
jgi:hypothetical protein